MRLPRRYLLCCAPLVAAGAIGVSAAAGEGSAVPAPTAAVSGDANSHLTCVAPRDAAAIDAMLGRAGSPLAGDGATIVAEGVAAGIDPRFIVAVAAHETMLETYGPAQAINNPFGLGPNMRFGDDADAVRFAARLLARHYVGEGRSTIPLIGSKWAPVGATNDPGGLNQHWTAGVGRYYATLGGDPYAPITLERQTGTRCGAGLTPAPAPGVASPPAPGSGPAQVVVWDGTIPAGAPDAATIPGFVFPLAVPADGEVRYTAATCAPGAPCAVPLESAPMALVVASVSGTLTAATAEEQSGGAAFWVVTATGERIGYGPLASYEPGIAAGVAVTAGQPLGRTTGAMSFRMVTASADRDPFPLLSATRPPQAAATP